MNANARTKKRRKSASKSIVITLTPNPALDLSGLVPVIVPNEKNSVVSERRDPGGNGINAARVACRLGVPTLALGFAGGGAGRELEDLLRTEKIPCRFTRIAGHTRTNVTVSVEKTHQQTRLSFPGPHVTTAEEKRLLAEFERTLARHPHSIALLGGSLPPGTRLAFWKRCLELAHRHDCEAALDLPARALIEFFPPQGGRSLAKKAAPLFFKPNSHELGEWASIDENAPLADLARAGSRLVRASGAAFVLVSLGARGALVVNARSALHLRAPKIHAKGTVGAGDSTVGALAAALLKSGLFPRSRLEDELTAYLESGGERGAPSLRRAFQLGLAAGAATAEEAGTALARASRIRQLSREVTVAEFFPQC